MGKFISMDEYELQGGKIKRNGGIEGVMGEYIFRLKIMKQIYGII
jgi:hypothetical protein